MDYNMEYETKQYNHKCEYCDFTARYIEIINTHWLAVHATKEEKKAHYKYFCEACNMGANEEYTHKLHLNVFHKTNK
jgi:hypothetical protein